MKAPTSGILVVTIALVALALEARVLYEAVGLLILNRLAELQRVALLPARPSRSGEP